jgi:hypothetical protein
MSVAAPADPDRRPGTMTAATWVTVELLFTGRAGEWFTERPAAPGAITEL